MARIEFEVNPCGPSRQPCTSSFDLFSLSQEHGLSPFVTAKHRDVLANGFEHENLADAVFLDLPAPWSAIEHVMKVLKKTGIRQRRIFFSTGSVLVAGGRLCSFSPCIEQVQRTCQRLRANGFEEINTVECLRRIHEFRYQHRSQISFTADQKPEEMIEEISIKADAMDEEEVTSNKREATEGDEEETTPSKKLKSNSHTAAMKKQSKETDSFLTAVGPLVMPGHTGYLTFAYLKQM